MSRRIPETESLTVEFKSDRRRLGDEELVLAAVCLANTQGGVIYLGVEKDGEVSGLHAEHRDVTGLAALVANRSVPPLSVRVSIVEEMGLPIAMIEVPRSMRLVATSSGTLQRRRLKADGSPECSPFLPHEFVSRESDLGLIDYSALGVVGATLDDLDPIERLRLRRAIEANRGDLALLGLDDHELDGALGLIKRDGDRAVPTVTGILMIGREGAIREHLPTHEVAFQVLDGEEVRVNDFFRLPLIRLFERVEELFSARVVERELQTGMFRVPVPNVDRRAFREALVNALTHRDYTRLGAVHVRWLSEMLTVSSPGGFIEGVTLSNLLVVEPRPRNPLLADAFKRIGLSERTGRGVDLIFQGLLRFGRPAPDYGRSDSTGVVVELSCAEADLQFLALVLEEEQRTQSTIPLDNLIVLSELRAVRRLDVNAVAHAIQKSPAVARGVLERLVESGLVEAHGATKGRYYVLSGRVYRALGQSAGYVRQIGFSPLQHEQMVRRYVLEHGEIRRKDVVVLCGVNPGQASRLLTRLTKAGVLVQRGHGKGTSYLKGSNL